MQDNKNHVEVFNEDSIITLYDDEQKAINFYEVASVEFEEKFYGILQPVDKIEGIEEDEAVIFEYSADEEGSEEKLFKPVMDEKILEAVFALYIQAAADFEATGSGCEGKHCGGCAKGKKE